MNYCEILGDMSTEIELRLTPVKPTKRSDIALNAMPTVRAALSAAGKKELLDKGDIKISQSENFPDLGSPFVTIVITLASNIALETYKQVILPKLKELCQVREIKARDSEKRKRIE
jgi:hypothetical protein